ncbi:PQ loop repeat-domain-containing protein [Scheffersomyces amazonensis]|uniref:PQ loop repeat-domain-containing protein n=1 Tax=Scheffersomyces amazonensis TaxID=1078765 RepID=UPI00315D4253
MINIVMSVLTSEPVVEPWRRQISGLMGSTSLACWIVLLMPQLIEQWRLKSAEGIAIGFISIWFLGDVFNLIGSIWAKLLPEVVFLAVWFCIADFLMIFSYIYYTHIYPKHHQHPHHHHHHPNQHKKSVSSTRSQGTIEPNGSTPTIRVSESTPLVTAGQDHEHHHHHSHDHEHDHDHEHEHHHHHRRRSSTLTDIALEPEYHSIFTKYILPILFVVATGILGFYLGSAIPDKDTDNPNPIPTPEPQPIQVGPQIMGYLSALLYLGARIPQIIQNHKRKSVHGLSLLFFLFSTLGNLTYAGQILFYRNDHEYILLNLSWLLGSLGTIFEDSIIFLQFYIYKDSKSEDDDEDTTSLEG